LSRKLPPSGTLPLVLDFEEAVVKEDIHRKIPGGADPVDGALDLAVVGSGAARDSGQRWRAAPDVAGGVLDDLVQVM
jgi:hypothetical protein